MARVYGTVKDVPKISGRFLLVVYTAERATFDLMTKARSDGRAATKQDAMALSDNAVDAYLAEAAQLALRHYSPKFAEALIQYWETPRSERAQTMLRNSVRRRLRASL